MHTQHHLAFSVIIIAIYKLTRKIQIAFMKRVNKHIRIHTKQEHNNYNIKPQNYHYYVSLFWRQRI